MTKFLVIEEVANGYIVMDKSDVFPGVNFSPESRRYVYQTKEQLAKALPELLTHKPAAKQT